MWDKETGGWTNLGTTQNSGYSVKDILAARDKLLALQDEQRKHEYTARRLSGQMTLDGVNYNPFYGLPVYVSEAAMCAVWVFPQDRFIEYTKEDERTCRYFGIGHEEMKPCAYLMVDPETQKQTLIVHPAIADKLKTSDVITARNFKGI